jgi:hypothetical protein
MFPPSSSRPAAPLCSRPALCQNNALLLLSSDRHQCWGTNALPPEFEASPPLSLRAATNGSTQPVFVGLSVSGQRDHSRPHQILPHICFAPLSFHLCAAIEKRLLTDLVRALIQPSSKSISVHPSPPLKQRHLRLKLPASCSATHSVSRSYCLQVANTSRQTSDEIQLHT